MQPRFNREGVVNERKRERTAPKRPRGRAVGRFSRNQTLSRTLGARGASRKPLKTLAINDEPRGALALGAPRELIGRQTRDRSKISPNVTLAATLAPVVPQGVGPGRSCGRGPDGRGEEAALVLLDGSPRAILSGFAAQQPAGRFGLHVVRDARDAPRR